MIEWLDMTKYLVDWEDRKTSQATWWTAALTEGWADMSGYLVDGSHDGVLFQLYQHVKIPGGLVLDVPYVSSQVSTWWTAALTEGWADMPR